MSQSEEILVLKAYSYVTGQSRLRKELELQYCGLWVNKIEVHSTDCFHTCLQVLANIEHYLTI